LQVLVRVDKAPGEFELVPDVRDARSLGDQLLVRPAADVLPVPRDQAH
jgi:hypothetical protein